MNYKIVYLLVLRIYLHAIKSIISSEVHQNKSSENTTSDIKPESSLDMEYEHLDTVFQELKRDNASSYKKLLDDVITTYSIERFEEYISRNNFRDVFRNLNLNNYLKTHTKNNSYPIYELLEDLTTLEIHNKSNSFDEFVRSGNLDNKFKGIIPSNKTCSEILEEFHIKRHKIYLHSIAERNYETVYEFLNFYRGNPFMVEDIELLEIIMRTWEVDEFRKLKGIANYFILEYYFGIFPTISWEFEKKMLKLDEKYYHSCITGLIKSCIEFKNYNTLVFELLQRPDSDFSNNYHYKNNVIKVIDTILNAEIDILNYKFLWKFAYLIKPEYLTFDDLKNVFTKLFDKKYKHLEYSSPSCRFLFNRVKSTNISGPHALELYEIVLASENLKFRESFIIIFCDVEEFLTTKILQSLINSESSNIIREINKKLVGIINPRNIDLISIIAAYKQFYKKMGCTNELVKKIIAMCC